MTCPICDYCSAEITQSNRAHPGYCRFACRDDAQAERQRRVRATDPLSRLLLEDR